MLILLNGPPGIGKSTIARRYAADRPLALCLDLDDIRRLLGRWQDSPEEAGLLTRRMALAMVRAHLATGHDVVVPQYLGRPEFIQELEQTAADAGATFHEIVLMDTRQHALDRFAARGSDPGSAVRHREAEAQAGGEAGLGELYDRLVALLPRRPHARIVESRPGEPDDTYRRLIAVVESGG